jgi:hypothetical protein
MQQGKEKNLQNGRCVILLAPLLSAPQFIGDESPSSALIV